MNKKRIILGLLIAVVAVICGAFITNTPQVFAVEQPEQQVESVVNEAGTFYGQGYYTLNSTATLKAEMNAGYQFDAWVAIDEVLNETELSTEREYTFVVDKNVTIKPTWHKIEYNVTFDEDLYIEETTELKDFTYQIVNKTEDGQPYYYENSIEIKVEIKNGNYIYDLESANITINGNNIGVALGETGSCVVNNNEKTGFRNFVITLNITEDIEIDINYIYMYALQIVSGDDSIDIGEIIQFVTISNHYSQPDNNEYIYLVRADKQVNVTVNNGNDVYQFVSSQFQGQDPNFLFSQAYTLEGNRTLTLNYHKKEYIIQFTSYITNLHGINDLLATEIYSIDDVDKVTAGDTVGFVYDSVSRDITITDVAGNPHIYSHANNIYGYEFKGFAIDNNILVDDTYTLSNAAPSNIEIQLIFEYIEYDFKILLVDDYFESDVTYDRSTKQVVVGTEINLEASTTTYAIMGWSWSPTPKTDGYVVQAEPDSTSHTYLLTFEPRSDDNTQPYIMYLDVDYKYLSATFALKNNSINQNVVYDILTVNTSEKTIIFSDSENIKSSDTISYLDSDVTIDGSKTIISTAKYGNIEIEGNVLSYTVNSIKQSSVAMTTEGADYIYTFKKYTYFGDLQLSVIQEITLSETASDVTFVLRGSTYSHQTTDPDSVTIEDLLTKTTTKTEESVGVYKINYTYPMYLYMNEAQYDYIILRNVRYDYDGTKFVLINATINTPKPIDLDLETGLNYGVKLNNLLPNALLMYSTKTTNVDLYQFTSLANQTGTVLLNFVDNAYNSCILNISSASQINATYRQLSDNINLVINNERAYSYEKISISVQHEGTTTSTTGDVVSAVNGDTITIAIQSSEITPGYKFNNYLFNDSTMLEDTNEDIYILTFVMDLSKYAKEVINLSFSPIEYTVNINYINSSSEIINKENAKGAFKIQGEANAYSSYIVKLPDETNPLCEYEFEAVAENGYYVSKAYTGTETYNITSLVQDNSSIQTKTTWTLNEFNFVDAIVAPAGEGTEVNLYICFTIHTYSVKVYFEIDSNASVIDYPTAIINDSTYTFIKASEIIGGIDATRYYVFAEGIEYNSDVNIQLDNFMLGTMMLKWTDMSGNTIKETTSTYSIANINQDIKLKAVLQYIPYRLQFVTIDESGKNCSYGTVTTVSQTVKMYNDVTYYVNTEVGYILYEKYYYNNIDEKVILSNESNTFAFDPANFKLEGTTVKIYFVFTLKVVNLSISNTIDGFMHYYEDKQESELATYTVTRARNGDIEQLTDETGYEFKTGDVLIMKITPISIGVQLSKVQLGATTITTLSNLPYKLSVVNIKDMEDNITGVYYDLQIEFTAGVISALSETTTLQNVIQVKEYNVTYTYNYIDYKFGIQLRRQVGGSTSTGVADTAMNIENLGFGTGVTFTYMYGGLEAGPGSNFKVNGFTVAGINQNVQDRFVFNDIELWKQVALDRYIANSNEIVVVLILQPKIILNNSDSYSVKGGYVYQRQYIGEQQGLTNTGANPDVLVGGEFNTVIQYSYDSGATFVDLQPINVGTYFVKIVAKISGKSEVTDVVFDEQVTYIITPAQLTIKLSDETELPITKTYDGNKFLPSEIIAGAIEFEGIYPIDERNVYININALKVHFEDAGVNSEYNLYDITLRNIQLLDKANQTIKNYVIASGGDVIFSDIGKINPKDLRITGFVVTNKVYDGTDSVNVDVSGITYIGTLEGDSAVIPIESLRFYLEDYSVGENRKVLIDWPKDTSIIGAQSKNYTITYDEKYINVHPYEITYILKDYGTFKIVDVDKLCLIPIGARMIAEVHDKGSVDYRNTYTIIEPEISQGEKLRNIYEITMRVGAVNQLVPQGLYIYIPKVNKVTKVLQVPDEDQIQELKSLPDNDYTIVKVIRGQAVFGVIVRTTYLPLWAIILIIVAAALVVGIFVVLFIIIRRKTKQKYSKYDKI